MAGSIRIIFVEGLTPDDVLKLKGGGFFDDPGGKQVLLPPGATGQAVKASIPETARPATPASATPAPVTAPQEPTGAPQATNAPSPAPEAPEKAPAPQEPATAPQTSLPIETTEDGVPEAIRKASTIRGFVTAVQEGYGFTTGAQILEWCAANVTNEDVPILGKIPDVEKSVTRACSMLKIPLK